MESNLFVYQKEDKTFFVSKSENWDNTKAFTKVAKIKAVTVRKITKHCKEPFEVGAVGVTTNGTTVKVISVEMI